MKHRKNPPERGPDEELLRHAEDEVDDLEPPPEDVEDVRGGATVKDGYAGGGTTSGWDVKANPKL